MSTQKKCCVPGCKSIRSACVKLYRFPNPAIDSENYRTWIMRIGGDIIGLDDKYIYRNRRVCSIHFESNYIYTKKISKTAIPTLHIGSHFASFKTKVDKVDAPAVRQEHSVLASEPQECSDLASEPQECSDLASEPQECSDLAADPQQCSNLAAEPQQRSDLASEPQEYSDIASESHECSDIASESQELCALAAESQEHNDIVSGFQRGTEITSPQPAIVEDIQKVACRCCLTVFLATDLVDMNGEYYNDGEREVYLDMLKVTFDIAVFPHVKCVICEECIGRLREAAHFRSQVLEAEETIRRLWDETVKDTEQCSDTTPAMTTEYEETINDSSLDTAVPINVKIEIVRLNENADTVPEFEIEYQDTNNHGNLDTSVSNDEKMEVDAENENADGWIDIKESVKDDNRDLDDDELSSIWGKNANQEAREQQEFLDIYKVEVLKENTITLIANSNMCVFTYLKGSFKCYCCGNLYFTIDELREHTEKQPIDKISDRITKLNIAIYLHVDISSLMCKLCQQPIEDLTSLTDHLKTTHNMQFNEDTNLLIPYKLKDGCICLRCNADLKSFPALSIHMNTHYRNHVCDRCGTTFTNISRLRHHIEGHKMKQCAYCSAVFKTLYARSKHMISEHKIKISDCYCKQCNIQFLNIYQLSKHRADVHSEFFICFTCGKVFHVKLKLEAHMKSMHSKEKNNCCSVCDKMFETRTEFVKHSMLHREPGAHVCPICDASFSLKRVMSRHINKYH